MFLCVENQERKKIDKELRSETGFSGKNSKKIII